LKKITSICALLLCSSGIAYATEYQATGGTIHTVKVTKGWCGNLAISTKVGHYVDNKCAYEKETQPYGYDGCTQTLNGGLLEMKVGRGYTCGATHIHSNVFGGEALDEYQFQLDTDGRYAGTNPAYSTVELPK
jgi:hypothetical protein